MGHDPIQLTRHASVYFRQYKNKVIILTGARQTGKTWLCMEHAHPDKILNFDLPADRKEFKNFENYPSGLPFQTVFVDEIHKLRNWRSYLKGYFDKFKTTRFVVSGSSAFELLKNERGDSLAGRTLTVRIEPVTFREFLLSTLSEDEKIRLQGSFYAPIDLSNFFKEFRQKCSEIQKISELRRHWETYFQFGGFPELLSYQESSRIAPWLREYMQSLLYRDLKDLAGLKDSDRVEQTVSLLLESVGSSYSLRGMAEVLQCSPNTIKSDIQALRKLLWGFELPTSHIRKARQIQTEKKLYPVDWILNYYAHSPVQGALFENSVVSAVHRHLNFQNFARLAPLVLTYSRNYQKEELDLVIQDRKNLLFAIEIKSKAKGDDLAKVYRLIDGLGIPFAVVVTGTPGIVEYYKEKVLHISAEIFFSTLW